jgi:hypothetical protein
MLASWRIMKTVSILTKAKKSNNKQFQQIWVSSHISFHSPTNSITKLGVSHFSTSKLTKEEI